MLVLMIPYPKVSHVWRFLAAVSCIAGSIGFRHNGVACGLAKALCQQQLRIFQ